MTVDLRCGDALTLLREMPERSVQTCVTSPPYYGLRDYGVAGQLGLERTPEEYVAGLVEVFREVRRVLRDDGTLWLNLGSSYSGSTMTGGNNGINASGGTDGFKQARQFKKPSSGGKPPSQLRSDAPACGSDDTAPLDSRTSDPACPGSGDGFQVEMPTHHLHNVHSDQCAEQCVQRPSPTDRGSEPEDSSSASPHASQHDAQESTTHASSRPALDVSGPSAKASASPSTDDSSSACERHCADRSWLDFSRFSQYVKPKDLVPIPWMVAMALQADGWYLRADLIWAKPNPMPESVTDRCTKSHEYIFLLSKSARYMYDAEAIAEPCETDAKENYPARARVIGRGGLECLEQSASPQQRTSGGLPPRWPGIGPQHGVERDRGEKYEPMETHPTRNARSVWTIATTPFPEAHFATFPPELPRRCILAGSRGPGKRCDCAELIATPLASGPVDDPTSTTGRAGMNRTRREGEGSRDISRREQRGYAQQMKDSPHRRRMEIEAGKAFAHYIRTDLSGGRPLPPDLLNSWLERGWLVEPPPCSCPVMPGDTVLDPFCGAGTTGLVADRLWRSFIGLELNPKYVKIARRRITSDAPLFHEVSE